MSAEQLTGLQLAVKLLAQIGDDDSDRAIAAVHDLAEEHAQRLKLQHHADDLAQRVLGLVAERDTLRARLAQIEDQEPVAWQSKFQSEAEWSAKCSREHFDVVRDRPQDWPEYEARPLYARPVPAIPAGWRLVPVEPTQEQWNAGARAARECLEETGGNNPAVIYRAMINESPEHKA